MLTEPIILCYNRFEKSDPIREDETMGLFGLDRVRKHDEDTELLETVYDPVREAMLCGLLEEEKIPYLRQERGSGDAMRILAGYSLYGTDILVPKRDLERAEEIARTLSDSASDGEETAAGDSGNESDT